MLSTREQLIEWDRLVAMCKGTKFESEEQPCVKFHHAGKWHSYLSRYDPHIAEFHRDRIFAVAIVDDTPIWLEEPFKLYSKVKGYADLEFSYDNSRECMVGNLCINEITSLRVTIPRKIIVWENFTLSNPSESMNESSSSNSNVDTEQVGGTHYRDKAIQPWAYMEANFTKEEFVGFLKGNAFKYVMRYQDKNGVEDLKKAIHYLEKLIQIESKS